MKLYSLILGNKRINNLNNNYLNIFSVFDKNKQIGKVPLLSKQLINEILISSKDYFNTFKKIPFKEKKEKILNFVNLLIQNKEEFLFLFQNEIAKNINDSLAEFNRSIQYIYETIEQYEKNFLNPIVIDEKQHKIKGKKAFKTYEPIGVVLAISPFNYPLNLLISKIIPALLCGNIVIFKPSTQGCLIGILVANLLYEAGFNNGEIFSIVAKGKEIGDILYNNEYVDMITFTGSTNVGEKILKTSNNKKVILELGGNDCAIVLEDANLEISAKEIVKGAFSYNGQRCTAIKRVIAHQNIIDKLCSFLLLEVNKLTVGSVLQNTFITELISKEALNRALDLVDKTLKEGAKIINKIQISNELILHPLLLKDIKPNMTLMQEEAFAPILPICSFTSFEEAIKIANSSPYGLQCSVFTTNPNNIEKHYLDLDFFTININRSSSRGPDILPFGGRKKSGFGIQGINEAILSMLQIKIIIYNE